MSVWKWIYFRKKRLCDIGTLADGTLHNPNGYPEADVRAAIAYAEEERAKTRREGAAKAAKTRAIRRERDIAALAQLFLSGQGIGRQTRCAVCRKRLDDEASMTRGVGPECWNDLQLRITRCAGDAQ
jgi:hypothetical protein